MYTEILYDGVIDSQCVNSIKIYSNGLIKFAGTIISDVQYNIDHFVIKIYRDYVSIILYTFIETEPCIITRIFRKLSGYGITFSGNEDSSVIINSNVYTYSTYLKIYTRYFYDLYWSNKLRYVDGIINNPLLYYVSQNRVASMNELDIDFGKKIVRPMTNTTFKRFFGFSDIIIQIAE